MFNLCVLSSVLIADETLSAEERQRMKVAFAEGYLAGSGQRTPGRTLKWLKIIQQLLTIVIFLALFISFMGKSVQWRCNTNNNIIMKPRN
jgi:ATP-dependent metalloprotease